MRFSCPLCHQPVSATLYQKITGIWTERKKLLVRVKEERAKLRGQIQEEKARLRQARIDFSRKRSELVRNAVLKKTRRLQSQLMALKKEERRIKEYSELRLQRAIKSEHDKAKKQANRIAQVEIMKWRRENRAFLRDQIKRARESARASEREKYHNARYKLDMTLRQMKTQDMKLRERQERIRQLERQLREHTTPQMEGLLYEKALIQQLKKQFPEDKFVHEGKAGDVLHFVMNKDWKAGVIVYECKRVQHYFSKYVLQTLAAKEKRQADYAILVTNAMKKGTQGFCVEKDVLIVHATGVVSLASVLRSDIIRIAEMKLGKEERDQVVKLTMEYLQGPEFTNSMSAIVGETISLYQDLTDEMKRHIATWRKRYNSYSKIHREALVVRNTTKEVLSGNDEYRDALVESNFPALPDISSLQQA